MPRPTSIGPRPHRRCKNTSKKGTRAEHELRDHLREKGCLVVNAKASKGPCDLLVLRPAAVPELRLVGLAEAITAPSFLIEVKSGKANVWAPGRARLRALAALYGAIALIARRADGLSETERWTIEVA